MWPILNPKSGERYLTHTHTRLFCPSPSHVHVIIHAHTYLIERRLYPSYTPQPQLPRTHKFYSFIHLFVIIRYLLRKAVCICYSHCWRYRLVRSMMDCWPTAPPARNLWTFCCRMSLWWLSTDNTYQTRIIEHVLAKQHLGHANKRVVAKQRCRVWIIRPCALSYVLHQFYYQSANFVVWFRKIFLHN